MMDNKEILRITAIELMAFLSCVAILKALMFVGWFPDFHLSIAQLFAAYIMTFIIGGFAEEWFEGYLFRRKIVRIGREVAKYKGVNPKSLKYDNIKVTESEDGMVDIEIEINDEQK